MIRFPWFAAVAMTSGVHAAVVFDAERVEVVTDPLAAEAVATYHFKNTGPDPVKIIRVDTGCDCLSASTDRTEIPAGETGVIRAAYQVENVVGEVEKAMTLHITDPERPEIRLGLAVKVPALVELDPKMTRWTLGGKSEAKEFTFKVKGDAPIVVRQAVGTKPEYKVELFEVKSGWEYRVRITPPEVLEPTVGAVKITTDHPHPKYRRMMAFFSVDRPK